MSTQDDEEKRFWGAVSASYTKPQVNLMKAFSRSHQKSVFNTLWFHSIAPQWFFGAPPLKGLKRIPAPTLDPASMEKFKALWNLAESTPNSHIRNVALLYANIFLIEAFFPDEYQHRLPPVTSVLDFDPKANNLEDVVLSGYKTNERWRALGFDIRALDCIRICMNER